MVFFASNDGFYSPHRYYTGLLFAYRLAVPGRAFFFVACSTLPFNTPSSPSGSGQID